MVVGLLVVVGALVFGALVVGALVVGALVVGALVVGATIVGAMVVGLLVVGALAPDSAGDLLCTMEAMGWKLSRISQSCDSLVFCRSFVFCNVVWSCASGLSLCSTKSCGEAMLLTVTNNESL
jgi:hypothetical protein